MLKRDEEKCELQRDIATASSILAKSIPDSGIVEASMMLTYDIILSSVLHHPLRVDSGTPMSRATAAL